LEALTLILEAVVLADDTVWRYAWPDTAMCGHRVTRWKGDRRQPEVVTVALDPEWDLEPKDEEGADPVNRLHTGIHRAPKAQKAKRLGSSGISPGYSASEQQRQSEAICTEAKRRGVLKHEGKS
jgi:hypothetical protein